MRCVPLLIIYAAGACAGCGPSTADVRGTVKRGGNPVTKGTVIVVDSTNNPHSGEIQPDGTYLIKGVLAGPVRVYAYSRPPSAASMRTKDAAAPAAPDPADIPAKYGNPDTSGLATTLKSGDNEYNLELN